MGVATVQYEEALFWCQRQFTAKTGISDLLQEFQHVLFHNNAPYHSKRNLRLMCEIMYSKLSREQHEELYERHTAQAVGISEQNAATYTCPLYASLISLITVLQERLIGRRLLCFSYGSGCAASMYAIRVIKPAICSQKIFEQLANRVVKSVHETLSLIKSFEGAYRSFPFQPFHTELHIPGAYSLTEINSLGVRTYTKQGANFRSYVQELGVGSMQLTLPPRLSSQTVSESLLSAAVRNASHHLLVCCHLKGGSPMSVDYLTQSPVVAVCHGSLDWAVTLSASASDVLVSTGAASFSDLQTGLTNLSAADAHAIGLVDAISSASVSGLSLQGLCMQPCNASGLVSEAVDSVGLTGEGPIELHWLECVAQLRFSPNGSAYNDDLDAVVATLLQHCELGAVVISGEMRRINSVIATVNISMLHLLSVPLLAVWSAHSHDVTMLLGCDWYSCTNDAILGTPLSAIQTQRSGLLNTGSPSTLGIIQHMCTERSVSVDAALAVAFLLCQVAPLGLQHTLQLMRTQPDMAATVKTTSALLDASPTRGCTLRTLQSFNLQQTQRQVATHCSSDLAVAHARAATATIGVYAQRHIDRTAAPPKNQASTNAALWQQQYAPLSPITASVWDPISPAASYDFGAVTDSLTSFSCGSDGCAVLELQDSRHYNAMDLPLMHAMRSALTQLKAFTDSGCILHSLVMQGAGANFCSGGAVHSDAVMGTVLSSLTSTSTAAAMIQDMSSCVTLLGDQAIPVVSLLHGKLTGGGIALALNTDWRLATLGAMFNHGNLARNHSPIAGLGGSFGCTIGVSTALGMYINDSMIEGQQALRIGLVDSLVSDVVCARQCAYKLHVCQLVNKSQFSTQLSVLELENVMHATSALQNNAVAQLTEVKSTAIQIPTGLAEQVQGLSLEETILVIQDVALQKAQEVAASTDLSAESPLMESGVDSLAATELVRLLQLEVGSAMNLSSTLVFDHPTATDIAHHIMNQLPVQRSVSPVTACTTRTLCLDKSDNTNSMCVVSSHATTAASCGEASTLLWCSLVCGHNAVQLIPAHRFQPDASNSVFYGHFASGD